MEPRSVLRDLLINIRNYRFLVIGDLYLDSYIFGQPARVSREAPIMVLEETRREALPGGGCAPGLALARLGAEVAQIGVIGDDTEGKRLVESLSQQGIDTSGVIVDRERPTTVKTRVVAEGAFNVFPQQISRIDRQDRSRLRSTSEDALVERIQASAGDVDAVVLSDYRSGVVTDRIIAAVRESSAFGSVDSQGSLRDFTGLDLIKCNQAEAEQVLGVTLRDETTRRAALIDLQRELKTDRLVVTLGPEGAAISSSSTGYREVPPLVHQQVFDVTGAGDTVIAVLTAGLAAGGTDIQSLQLSQIAAGIVVSRWGNVQASIDDLVEQIDRQQHEGTETL